MTALETYSFILCLIVYVVLIIVFSFFLACIMRQCIRLIRGGLEDESIYAEYKAKQRQKQRGSGTMQKVVSAVFSCLFFAVFAFTIYVNVGQNGHTTNLPTLRVVKSASMSKKYEDNKYLFEHNLDDQMQTFDLIVTYQLPDEFALQLYDIVVYEVDDALIVHRIVSIEEPNEAHPGCRYFRLQGDNVHVADKFPVKYEQMRAIYRGQRVPFIGSFIAFLQSPAGVLCLILVAFSVLVTPAFEKKIEREKALRLQYLLSQNQAVLKSEAQTQNDVVLGYLVYPDGARGQEVYRITTKNHPQTPQTRQMRQTLQQRQLKGQIQEKQSLRGARRE